jgi:hypothetical protein
MSHGDLTAVDAAAISARGTAKYRGSRRNAVARDEDTYLLFLQKV